MRPATFNMVVITGRAQENQDLAIPAEKILPAVRRVREAIRRVGIRTVFEDILPGVKVLEEETPVELAYGR